VSTENDFGLSDPEVAHPTRLQSILEVSGRAPLAEGRIAEHERPVGRGLGLEVRHTFPRRDHLDAPDGPAERVENHASESAAHFAKDNILRQDDIGRGIVNRRQQDAALEFSFVVDGGDTVLS